MTAQAFEQVGRLRFELPEGWQRNQDSSDVQFVPPGATPDQVTLSVHPTETPKQDPRTWFKAAVQRVLPSSQGLIQELPTRYSAGKVVIQVLNLAVQDEHGRLRIHVFAGVTDKNNAQLLHYRTHNANFLREHQAVLDQLSANLEFVEPRKNPNKRLLASLD